MKHIVLVVVLTMGHTATNMVNCRQRMACIEQWTAVAAVVTDGVTTEQYNQRCPLKCVEGNAWLYGLHPTTHRLVLTLAPIAFAEAATIQTLHDHHQPAASLAFTLGTDAGRARAAFSNTKLK